MANWTNDEIMATYEKIQEKAATDKDFRNIALNDPKKAIEQIAGKEVPSDIKIRFIENAPGVDQTFVLPDLEKEELSDAELDAVAGGGKCKINVCNHN